MAIYSTAKDAKLLGLFGFLDPAVVGKVADVIVYDKKQHDLNMVRVLKPLAKFLLDVKSAERLLRMPEGTLSAVSDSGTIPQVPVSLPDDTVVRVLEKWKTSGISRIIMEIKASQIPEVEEWIKKGMTFAPDLTFWHFELTSGKQIKKVTL